jgi:hypothetical protein
VSAAFWQPALGLVAPLVLGVALLRALGLRFASDRIAYPGWVWLAGSLATAGIEFLWLLFGLGTESALGRELVVVLAAGALSWLAREREFVAGEAPRGSRAERALFLVLLALALALVANKVLLGTLEPIYLDDEAHFWAARAKLLFTAGGFGPEYQAGLRTLAHGDYPLLDPLLQVWMFVHAGAVTHVINRLPLQLATLAVVFVLAGAARRHLRPAAAGLLVCAFLGSHLILSAAQRAHADLLVGLGALVVLDAWLRWRDTREDAWIALAALGAAYLGWAKNEGLLVLAAFAGVTLVVHLRARKGPELRLAHATWLLPFALVASTWLHNRLFEIKSDLLQETGARQTLFTRFFEQWSTHTSEVLAFFGDVLRDGEQFQLLPVVLAVLVLASPATARRLGPALAVLALVAAGYIVVLIGTPSSIDWQLRTAGKRLVLQLYPSIALLVAVLMGTWLAPRAPDEPTSRS